jgi:hypothetical protein
MYILLPDLPNQDEFSKNFYQYITLVVPLFIILFASPSTYVFNHLKTDHIEKVKFFITQEDIKTLKEIELLEDSIKILFKRAEDRFAFYRWIILSCSSIFFIFQTVHLRYIFLDNKIKDQILFDSVIIPITIAISLGLIAMILLSIYKRATMTIFNTIEHACISKKHSLLKTPKSPLNIPKRKTTKLLVV